MRLINIFPWKIYCDKTATRMAYEKINQGDAERCRCEHCLNFIEVRESAYPPKVQEIFKEIGIDYKKEAEVAHVYKTESGLHYYMGWFHFIGSVERLEENKQSHDNRFVELIKVDENFLWSFSDAKIGFLMKPLKARLQVKLIFL